MTIPNSLWLGSDGGIHHAGLDLGVIGFLPHCKIPMKDKVQWGPIL